MGGVEQSRATARDARDDGERVACPWCGSESVERLGEFGPGLMTEQYMCLQCHSPFEWIRKR
jgi:transposase-like protein